MRQSALDGVASMEWFGQFLYDWQTGLTGVLGFGAAILAVVCTLRSERRRAKEELEALRRSLGVELRQCTTFALTAHRALRRLAQSKGTPITSRMIERLVHLPEPVIFRACADKVGMLGPQAMDVTIFYSQLELVRAGIQKLLHDRTPDSIQPLPVATTAQALMSMAEYGRGVLPSMKTNVTQIDSRDATLIETITNESSQWDMVRQEWPQIQSAFAQPFVEPDLPSTT